LGASLFSWTLGVWWGGREELRPGRVVALMVLVTLGYFAHLVSLGLTAVGLVVLAVFAPGRRRSARLRGTLIALLPLIPLGLWYWNRMRRGGRLFLAWDHLTDPLSIRAWGRQLLWVDPLSLGGRTFLPFTGRVSPWFGALTPVVWVCAALALGVLAMVG